MDARFVVRVAVVSGLAALAFVLLRDGRDGASIAGAAIGALALAGIVALARIVITAERRSREKRS